MNGLNVVKINFTIGEASYSLDCVKSEFDLSYYGSELDGVDVLKLVKFLQRAFDDEGNNV
jgi:hypothetical protein